MSRMLLTIICGFSGSGSAAGCSGTDHLRLRLRIHQHHITITLIPPPRWRNGWNSAGSRILTEFTPYGISERMGRFWKPNISSIVPPLNMTPISAPVKAAVSLAQRWKWDILLLHLPGQFRLFPAANHHQRQPIYGAESPAGWNGPSGTGIRKQRTPGALRTQVQQ